MEKQKKIVLYNPAISSLNMGDHIIFDSIYTQLEELLQQSFVVEISTHLPVSKFLKYTKDFDYKFVCGSNLLRGKMNRPFRQWDITIFDNNVGPCILIGAGWWQYGDNPNFYTKMLYKKVLSHHYYHSVRDSYTESQLRKVGFENVINTSCPTMWGLTKDHCKEIPKTKSKNVVCTITDYNRNVKLDKKMIEILSNNYESVYLWLQGSQDDEYFEFLNIQRNNIKLIRPSLEAYDKVLEYGVDYVGTRLHAGIRALQKQRRTIIIAIDNRAIEKQKNFNLVCLSRNQIEGLTELINSEFETNIMIPEENIVKWKSQFMTSLSLNIN